MSVQVRRPQAPTQQHGLKKAGAAERHAAARKQMVDLVQKFKGSSSPNDQPAPETRAGIKHPGGSGEKRTASPAIAVVVTPTRPGISHGGGGQGPQLTPANDGITDYGYGTAPHRPGITSPGRDDSRDGPADALLHLDSVRASITHNSEGGRFIAGAIKRPGALTKRVGGKPGKNLKKVRRMAKRGSPLARREASFYLNVLRKAHH